MNLLHPKFLFRAQLPFEFSACRLGFCNTKIDGIVLPVARDNNLVAVCPLSDDATTEQELIALIDRMPHISNSLTVEEYILVG